MLEISGQSDGESDGECTGGGGGAGAQCEHCLPGQDGAPPHPHGHHLLHALPPPGHPPPHVSINHPPSARAHCTHQNVQSIKHNWMLAVLTFLSQFPQQCNLSNNTWPKSRAALEHRRN